MRDEARFDGPSEASLPTFKAHIRRHIEVDRARSDVAKAARCAAAARHAQEIIGNYELSLPLAKRRAGHKAALTARISALRTRKKELYDELKRAVMRPPSDTPVTNPAEKADPQPQTSSQSIPQHSPRLSRPSYSAPSKLAVPENQKLTRLDRIPQDSPSRNVAEAPLDG